MITKVYHGDKKTGKVFVEKVVGNSILTNEGYPLKHVIRHSTTGFSWGDDGSGQADLALSILTDALISKGMSQSEKAKTEILIDRIYQDFKSAVVSCFDKEFRLDEWSIRNWVKDKNM